MREKGVECDENKNTPITKNNYNNHHNEVVIKFHYWDKKER
jgi:hypothetical protein